MRLPRILLFIFLVTSCTSIPAPPSLPPDTAVTSPPDDAMPTQESRTNPFAPVPNDALLQRGQVYISEAGLLIRESYPPQISLSIRGDLPTPCHELRAAVTAPDKDNQIAVDVYSVVDPDVLCAQVLEPFEEQLDLGTFPSGHYSVRVNGQLAGEFDS